MCLACRECNLYKAKNVRAIDPLTGVQVALFHPVKQTWNDHFCWDDSATRIEGVTSIGRATVALLNMNSVNKVTVRQFWLITGKFPPVADCWKGREHD